MKITTLFLLGLMASNFSFSQTFSYSFSGELNASKIVKIEKKCKNIASVANAKFKYKEDSERGELILILEENQKSLRAEADNQFSPSDIKTIMIDNNLSPISFRKISE
jgi:hypothetical protein